MSPLNADDRRLLEEIRGDIKEIKTEVKATNGRVTKLEMWRYGMEQVKATRSWRFPALVGLVTGLTVTVLGSVLAVVIKLTTGG